MGTMNLAIELGIYLFAGFSGFLWGRMFFLPLLYGLPRATYWIWKGWVQKRALVFWCLRPIFSIIIFGFFWGLFLLFFLPSQFTQNNPGQATSLLNTIEIIFGLTSILTFFMFLTPKGRSRMTDYFITWTGQFVTKSGGEIVEKKLGEKEFLDKIKKQYADIKKTIHRKTVIWS